jgi:deazaflavin-dependent oxidoreductase (nitroreductase family)
VTESNAPDINEVNINVIEEFRANEGRVGGVFDGIDLLLLHHTGARSGAERLSPLAYQRVGESYAIFASRGGTPTNPDWFHNLVAHPEATIEVGTDTIRVTARVAEPAERDPIYERQKQIVPSFADYERRAAGIRTIPVVVLDPVK